MSPTVALLAAGSGRRFGAPKLLMPAGEGEVLLSRAASLALSVADRVLCVLPADAELHVAALAKLGSDRLILLENADAAQGMGTSVACAARVCLQRGLAADGLLVMPADLPTVDQAFLRRLVDAYAACDGCDAAAAEDKEGRLLAPAVLGPGLLPDISSLRGDEGARAILRRAGTRVAAVAIGEGEDIDDFRAFVRLARRLGWDRERLPDISWRDAPQGLAPPDGAWRVGSTLAASLAGHGPGISGFQAPGLVEGIRRILFAGESVFERLMLLRASALLSFADENW